MTFPTAEVSGYGVRWPVRSAVSKRGRGRPARERGLTWVKLPPTRGEGCRHNGGREREVFFLCVVKSGLGGISGDQVGSVGF